MSGELWRGHLATPSQERLAFEPKTRQREHRSRATQADVLLAMLRAARANRRPVQLPEIMAAGIAQHGARFNELRSRGFVINNETERSNNGRVLSRYWLVFDPERNEAPDLKPGKQTSAQALSGSGNLFVQERHRDDG